MKINPQLAEAVNNRGYALDESGQHEEANKAFNEESKKVPGFEMIFALTGLFIVTFLIRRRKG